MQIRIVFKAALALLVLAGIALAAVLWQSQRAIAHHYPIKDAIVARARDAGAVARGQHIARTAGCLHCHGEQLQGRNFYDDPKIARINAPNLSLLRDEFTDAQLERIIRHGIKRDGTTAWIMPAEMLQNLSDSDLSDLIAYVRSVPAQPGPMRETRIHLLGRVGILAGKLAPVVTKVASAPQHPAGLPVSELGRRGEYLVKTRCTECHGTRLEGWDFLNVPPMIVAAAYNEAQLRDLLHAGVMLGNRPPGLMSETSKARFSGFDDAELKAIYTYLQEAVIQRVSDQPRAAAPPVAAARRPAPGDASPDRAALPLH